MKTAVAVTKPTLSRESRECRRHSVPYETIAELHSASSLRLLGCTREQVISLRIWRKFPRRHHDDARHAESKAAHNFFAMLQSWHKTNLWRRRSRRRRSSRQRWTQRKAEKSVAALYISGCGQHPSRSPRSRGLRESFAGGFKALADSTHVFQSETRGRTDLDND